MTNIEWLNINGLFDTFSEDCWKQSWDSLINKYHITYNPKSDFSSLKIVVNWLNSKHKDLKKCIDKDALLEYIEDNDTSNNEQYYRINIDNFLNFVNMLDVHEIEV